VDAREIHAVALTHAHLDHSGYLPRLVAQGFRGRAFCTAGTADLCKLILPDSARLHEEDARQANRHGYSKHAPALPLYRETDAFRAISQLQPFGFDRPVEIAPGVEIEFIKAGHLLGSAFIRMTRAGPPRSRILFGGDLGRYDRPVLSDPSPGIEADVLLCESTYGGRVHPPEDNGESIAQIVRETIGRGGRVVVPCFAVGRVEEVLYWIKRLEDERRIPVVPVFVDSPMAVEALKFYQARGHELDPGMRNGSKLVTAFTTTRLTSVASPAQSKELTASETPAIILSASGMATGGRVLHHLKKVLPYAKHTVLFAGFQAAGTRGRALIEGASEVKIHGQWVPVNARIARTNAMSAHADSAEVLRWLGTFPSPPGRLYLVHGEPTAMDAMKGAIAGTLGWGGHTPELGETVEF
jgi:metallo-beta-lactamase family protein